MKRIHEQDINTPAHYERMWTLPTYEQMWKETDPNKRFDTGRMKVLTRRVKNGDAVLELGAGLFGAAQYIYEQKQVLYGSLTALDYCQKAQEIVLARFPQGWLNDFRYLVGDIRKTNFQDACFDVVIAGEVIEHMEDPAAFATEMARLCKRGGWLTISSVNPHCADAVNAKLEYPEHLWDFEPADLLGFFKPYGDVQYFVTGDYHCLECHRA